MAPLQLALYYYFIIPAPRPYDMGCRARTLMPSKQNWSGKLQSGRAGDRLKPADLITHKAG